MRLSNIYLPVFCQEEGVDARRGVVSTSAGGEVCPPSCVSTCRRHHKKIASEPFRGFAMFFNKQLIVRMG